MINIVNKPKCCGCSACVEVCPKNCIEMKMDKEGFVYPSVDAQNCISCDLCERVCPELNLQSVKNNTREAMQFYAAYNKESSVVKESSSGGVFWPIVEEILSQNGVVYGCMSPDINNIYHSRATTIEEAKAFRGSKYLQSDISGCFEKAKKDLEAGSKVLFSGTPCQIAGLYAYLGKKYDNLITIDVVCHGVPSRSVFDKYLEELSAEKGKRVKKLIWRYKETGWGPNHIATIFEDDSILSQTSAQNDYQTGFLNNVYLRPSCYECPFACLPRIADISLADFWGYKGELKEENNNKGLSLVIVSSSKGQKIFEKIKVKLRFHNVDEQQVRRTSRHSWIHPKYNFERNKFYEAFYKNGFKPCVRKYIRKNKLETFLFKVNYKIMAKIKKCD